ncbi:hypothetical protein KWD47_04485 [Acinetobacter baumannii]
MDNYKIKVKDEASADEARDLFKKLGYHPDNSSYEPYVEWVAVFEDGSGSFYRHNMNLDECVEITIAQLRDLVVLKRNDVRDATHTCENDFKYICIDGRWHLMTTDGWFHVSVNPKALKPIQTVQAVLNNLDELREEYKDYHKDPALISGAEALRALADGKEVEYANSSLGCIRTNWLPVHPYQWSVSDIKHQASENNGGECRFRLKPQTIKVELEIPAPYKARIGGRDDTSFVLNVGRHQYLYQNEEEYTKARDALEAVFDAAVRGTNP